MKITREEAKELLLIMQAFAEGKAIQDKLREQHNGVILMRLILDMRVKR